MRDQLDRIGTSIALGIHAILCCLVLNADAIVGNLAIAVAAAVVIKGILDRMVLVGTVGVTGLATAYYATSVRYSLLPWASTEISSRYPTAITDGAATVCTFGVLVLTCVTLSGLLAARRTGKRRPTFSVYSILVLTAYVAAIISAVSAVLNGLLGSEAYRFVNLISLGQRKLEAPVPAGWHYSVFGYFFIRDIGAITCTAVAVPILVHFAFKAIQILLRNHYTTST